jgi:hypothetical protein
VLLMKAMEVCVLENQYFLCLPAQKYVHPKTLENPGSKIPKFHRVIL